MVDISENNIKKLTSYIMIIIYSTFIFSGQMRVGIIGEKLGIVNYIFVIAMIYIIIRYIKRFNIPYIFIWFNISIYFVCVSFFYQPSFRVINRSYISFILPLALIGLSLTQNEFKEIFKKTLVVINIIVILITIFGVIDYITGNKLIMIISQFMTNRLRELVLLQEGKTIHRMYSFMGHPLFNTQLYLMYYVLNTLYRKYFGNLISNALILIIPLIGLALTSSKTGFVLFLVSILFVNGRKINIRYYLGITLGIMISFKVGIFNNILERFAAGGLTTGRAETWDIIQQYNIFPLKFFTGYGTGFTFNYNDYISWASAGFEYPFRMFSLELGQFIMLMIYFCILILPVYILVKRRHLTILLGYMIIFLDVNTYNGLSLIGDYMLILSIFIFLILNLSKYVYTDNKIKNVNSLSR